MMQEAISNFIIDNLQADSIGSIILRAVVWVILVTIFAIGVAQGKSMTRVKSEAGFFLLFLVLTAAAIYFAFGFIPTLTTIEEVSYLAPIFSLSHLLLADAPSRLQKISSYFLQT